MQAFRLATLMISLQTVVLEQVKKDLRRCIFQFACMLARLRAVVLTGSWDEAGVLRACVAVYLWRGRSPSSFS